MQNMYVERDIGRQNTLHTCARRKWQGHNPGVSREVIIAQLPQEQRLLCIMHGEGALVRVLGIGSEDDARVGTGPLIPQTTTTTLLLGVIG